MVTVAFLQQPSFHVANGRKTHSPQRNFFCEKKENVLNFDIISKESANFAANIDFKQKHND